jgi:hypothetical protein
MLNDTNGLNQTNIWGETYQPYLEEGWVTWTALPDGRFAGVQIMTFGKGRISIGQDPSGFDLNY